MPSAEQTLVANAIVKRVQAIVSPLVKFNDRNTNVVQEFFEPYQDFVNYLLQIRYPLCTPYGAGGGAYLQRITIEFGLFHKSASDPYGNWIGGAARLGEVARLVRQYLTDFSAGGLSINLYDTGQEMSPRHVRTETGEVNKNMIWTAWSSWGVWGGTVTEFRRTP